MATVRTDHETVKIDGLENIILTLEPTEYRRVIEGLMTYARSLFEGIKPGPERVWPPNRAEYDDLLLRHGEVMRTVRLLQSIITADDVTSQRYIDSALRED